MNITHDAEKTIREHEKRAEEIMDAVDALLGAVATRDDEDAEEIARLLHDARWLLFDVAHPA